MKKIILILSLGLMALSAYAQNKPVKTAKELLQGKWQSVDDEQNFLVFENNMRKEIASGMKTWQVEPFEISDKCLNGNPGAVAENDKYIVCPESNMCWYIVSVNEHSLVLSYTDRGNTLEYRRAK